MPKFDYEATKPQIAFKQAVKKTPDHMGNALVLLAFVAGTLVLYIIVCAMIVSKHVYYMANCHLRENIRHQNCWNN